MKTKVTTYFIIRKKCRMFKFQHFCYGKTKTIISKLFKREFITLS